MIFTCKRLADFKIPEISILFFNLKNRFGIIGFYGHRGYVIVLVLPRDKYITLKQDKKVKQWEKEKKLKNKQWRK